MRAEVIRLRREKRAGHEIIVIEGFPADVDVSSLARELRRRCGTGGTLKGRCIEIQGDHRDLIAEVLLERGFRSKRAGG
jgi:translation initiation factor 1